MQAVPTSTNNENKWRFAQCFGDKGESDDITEGTQMREKIDTQNDYKLNLPL